MLLGGADPDAQPEAGRAGAALARAVAARRKREQGREPDPTLRARRALGAAGLAGDPAGGVARWTGRGVLQLPFAFAAAALDRDVGVRRRARRAGPALALAHRA